MKQKIDEIHCQNEQLEMQKQALLQKRKEQIAAHAEKLKILTVDDHLILGALTLVKHTIDENNQDELERLYALSHPFQCKTNA